MRRRTITKRLHEAISNKHLLIVKAECAYKSSNRIDGISKETFQENLDFLSESGVFADCIGWHYEKISNSDGEYMIECGRMDGSVENVVTVYLRIGENTSGDDVERMLKIEEG